AERGRGGGPDLARQRDRGDRELPRLADRGEGDEVAAGGAPEEELLRVRPLPRSAERGRTREVEVERAGADVTDAVQPSGPPALEREDVLAHDAPSPSRAPSFASSRRTVGPIAWRRRVSVAAR